MIPIVMSATAFEHNEPACLQRINELIQNKQSAYTGLLLNTKLQQQNHSAKEIASTRITMADWIDDKQRALEIKIRSQANNLCTNQMIILDARHHDADIMSHVLHAIGKIWFHLQIWPPAFVLIVDDHYSTRFTRELSEKFYIQPLPVSKQALENEMRHIHRFIWAYRWLGFGRLGRLSRSTYILLRKIKHYANRKFS